MVSVPTPSLSPSAINARLSALIVDVPENAFRSSSEYRTTDSASIEVVFATPRPSSTTRPFVATTVSEVVAITSIGSKVPLKMSLEPAPIEPIWEVSTTSPPSTSRSSGLPSASVIFPMAVMSINRPEFVIILMARSSVSEITIPLSVRFSPSSVSTLMRSASSRGASRPLEDPIPSPALTNK